MKINPLNMYVPDNKTPSWRPFQIEAINAFNKSQRFAFVMARQHGKSVLGAAVLCDFMMRYNKRRNPVAMVVMESSDQAFRLYFEKIHNTFKGLPEDVYFKKGGGQGSPITVYLRRPWFNDTVRVILTGTGAAIRSSTLDFLICDEMAFFNEQLWYDVLAPTLDDTGAKCILTSTPNGDNFFYDIIKNYKEWGKTDSYYSSLNIDIHNANFRSEDFIKRKIQEYKAARKMAEYRRNYENDFFAGSDEERPFAQTVYRMRQNNQILDLPANDVARFLGYVNISVDIGKAGNMPFWTWVIDPHGRLTMLEYCNELQNLDSMLFDLDKKYPDMRRINLYLPHDIRHPSVEKGGTRLENLEETLYNSGLDGKISIYDLDMPKDKDQLLSQAVQRFKKCRADQMKCSEGLDNLASTRFKTDTKTNVVKYGKYVDNGRQHTADALCYIFAAIEQYKLGPSQWQCEAPERAMPCREQLFYENSKKDLTYDKKYGIM